ncbi:hypothetical protein CVT25_003746 [Psilocybe cyanescens]|uniref:Uncharacterized protein n=1 Tax=Psilocybe cyanescens TaxID=93625 RepID=A0A409XW55_PSICY|nr:hypothetical protein CVT25_003746 [Psilocybe cyanescens]
MDSTEPSLNMNPASSPPDTPNEVEKSLYPNRHILSEPSQTNTAHRTSEIPHGVIKYWILCCIAFCVSAPLMSTLLGFYLHTKDLNYNPPPFNPSNERTIQLVALLVSADPTSSTITFDWAIESDSGCAFDPSSGSLQGPCTDVNIFFDSNLLVSTGNTDSISSSDRPSTPLFRLNATAMATGDIKANSPTFRTDIRLFASGKPHRSALINYPFDTYFATMFMFAEDAENNTVGLQLVNAYGNAVGFRTTFTPLNQPVSDMILIEISLVRGGLIIAFCIIITIAIWLITLVLFLLSFTSVVFGFRQRTEVLIIPVATVFTFTQLRSSMPGAPPGFGTSYSQRKEFKECELTYI